MQSWKTHARFRKLIAGPVRFWNIFLADGDAGGKREKYSFSSIKKMEPLIDVRIEAWTQKLESCAKTNEKFDFSSWAV